MKVWSVWTESGEYSDYQETMEGLFTTRELAEDFAKQVKGAVTEEVLLDSPPVQVTVYTWADHVASDGKLSPVDPTWPNPGRVGRQREQWKSWAHQEQELDSSISKWDNKGVDLSVYVSGTDKEKVKAEYERLVEEARRRIKEQLREEN